MDERDDLFKAFQEVMMAFPTLSPESILEVDEKLLESLGLTDVGDYIDPTDQFDRSFKVIEGNNRITLFNNQFVIWIVPEILSGVPSTYAFIGIRENEKVKLEVVFLARGPFNSSRLVLRLLDRYLNEIQENEELIHKMEQN